MLTAAKLGRAAAALVQKHPYNFVLASSTSPDGIVEFYHSTPTGMSVACDLRFLSDAVDGCGHGGDIPCAGEIRIPANKLKRHPGRCSPAGAGDVRKCSAWKR